MHSKKKAIICEEKDHDILQVEDELDTAWVDTWKKELNDSEQSGISFFMPEKNAQELPVKKITR
jgi:hypothetical protein